MRLGELFERRVMGNDSLRVATTAALSRVVGEITQSGYKGKFKVKSLIGILRDHGINVDKRQLIELVKREPWSNHIADIRGDTVVFRGEPDDGQSMQREPSDTTLNKMAKRAGKKQAD